MHVSTVMHDSENTDYLVAKCGMYIFIMTKRCCIDGIVNFHSSNYCTVYIIHI